MSLDIIGMIIIEGGRMNISFWSAVSGAIILVVSSVYQICVERGAKKKAERIDQADNEKVKKYVEIHRQKANKLTHATRLTFVALVLSYGLSIWGVVTDRTEQRLKTLESQVADLKVLVGERR
jgi:hypothetical protein